MPLSDDWQTGCWRGITPYMQKAWDQQRARDFKALATVNQRVTAALEVLPALAEAADYASSGPSRCWKRKTETSTTCPAVRASRPPPAVSRPPRPKR